MTSSPPLLSAPWAKVALLWLLALALSAVPVLAGQIWPAALTARADLALLLVLLPPLGMALLLWRRWPLPEPEANRPTRSATQ